VSWFTGHNQSRYKKFGRLRKKVLMDAFIHNTLTILFKEIIC
jgi:hypothetical protein